MAIQKKHGKGRLDKWYKLAKEKGYRARAAFKLIQLNKKYGFLEKSRVLLDLCAAPGVSCAAISPLSPSLSESFSGLVWTDILPAQSWCQVAAEVMPVNSLIIGVDLSPIKPIPKVITFQSDITTDKCRAKIRQHLKTWKADTVLHDGAPNVGTAWTQDSFNQAELALQAMKLATEFLIEGGTFVTKVFRSKDYNPLLWVLSQLFAKVEATKPPSSRNVSAEIFVVCKGFKAPKRIDPRFLDPKSVFAELAGATPNNEARVFNPESKKRKREGYEEGDYTQFKSVPASEFVQTADPIAVLGSSNEFTFVQPPDGDVALAALNRLPETTPEIRTCCQDLKVLGRKEFKLLLRWRLKVRGIFGLGSKDEVPQEEAEEVAQVESMDDELRIQEELQAMRDRDQLKKKREMRKENERKQREIVRMQLNMTAPMDIGMEEAGPLGEGAMFSLNTIDKTDAMRRLARGKMVTVSSQGKGRDSVPGQTGDVHDESDDEEDRLERELDSMYDSYRERKAEADTKYRAKKAREERGDDEWEGLSENSKSQESESSELDEDDSSGDDDDENQSSASLLRDLDNSAPSNGGLSKRATAFFSQDIFRDITNVLQRTEAVCSEESGKKPKDVIKPKFKTGSERPCGDKPASVRVQSTVDSDSDEGRYAGFEAVKTAQVDDWEGEPERPSNGRFGEQPLDIWNRLSHIVLLQFVAVLRVNKYQQTSTL